ncbi:hypothetical protein FALBO_10970 [Fusarium albosuccineum]|uniref:Uncharacterized protein n=1 Tax=Fusarium albosuccineum TaxID=1237068 RepID=A0A8H4L6N6_9HYPO|nr:hypothetical protein FALBO_10970 [Fusarium albosuccineum]
MANANRTSTSTEVFITPPSSPSQLQSQHSQFPWQRPLPFLDVPFVENNFLQPNKVLGICCSARNIWYSKLHWPDDPQFADLFGPATEVQKKLMPDFDSIWETEGIRKLIERKPLSTTPYSYERRMAGVRVVNQTHITLQPSFWIRTTDEAIKKKTPWKKLKKLVKHLGLNSLQNADIYIEGGLRLADEKASLPKDPFPLDKGISFPNGMILYTHIQEKPLGASACGIVCLTTIIKDDVVLHQKHSRIGGLINYGSSRLGVTSGHVMLEHFLGYRARKGPESAESLSSGDSSMIKSDVEVAISRKRKRAVSDLYPKTQEEEPEEEESDDDLELIENGPGQNGDQEKMPSLGQVDLTGITQWISVMPFRTITFIGRAEPYSAQNSTGSAPSQTPRITTDPGQGSAGHLRSTGPSISEDLAPMKSWDVDLQTPQIEKELAQSSTWRFRFPEQPIPADFTLVSGLNDWKYENYYLNTMAIDQQCYNKGSESPITDGENLLNEDAGTLTSCRGLGVSDDDEERKWISGYTPNDSLTVGEVLVLANEKPPHIVASLRTNKVPLVINGTQFWTRKLLLEAPLCKYLARI